MIRQVVLSAGAAALLAGCSTYSLEELRSATPQGTPFQQALASLYLQFANNEEKSYDWSDSAYFADKGLLAVYGKDTAPEDLANWDIPEEVRSDLEQARATLVATLTPEMISKEPDMAAKAQFSFDCWVEQQEENVNEDEIAECRDAFGSAMQYLVYEEKAEKDDGLTTDAYIVFFERSKSSLSESGKRMIDAALEKLTQEEKYEIVLNAHTDTVGGAKFNLKLSQQRANAVKKRLVDGGASEDSIKIYAFGESDPPAKTKDGVDEPANRRVEIFLNE